MPTAAVRGAAFLPGTAPVGVGTPPPGAAGFFGGVPVDRPPPADWPGGKLGERAAGRCLCPCPAVRTPPRTRAGTARNHSPQPHSLFLRGAPATGTYAGSRY